MLQGFNLYNQKPPRASHGSINLMKTSRIAKETAKIVNAISHADFAPRRQTRSFARSLHSFTTGDLPLKEAKDVDVKQEDLSDDASTLSSVSSATSLDIEDFPSKSSPSRKRKRGIDTPATVTSVSAISEPRLSPRKPNSKLEDEGAKKVKKPRRQPAKSRINETGEVEIHAPANWEEIYDAVREMRKLHLAPVDTMGCETLAEEHLTPRNKRFQTLIALMLSSRKQVFRAIIL